MANSSNNFDNNTTVPLAESFLKAFECERVLSKTVDTQLLSGKFNPKSGTTADFRRPVDHKSDRTSDGNISAVDRSDIDVGKATGVVQDYFTVHMDWDEVDEALQMDKLDELVGKPAASRIATDLELDFGRYMYKNCGLHYGTPGSVVNAWSDVAGAEALMTSMGVPNDGERYYTMNPFTMTNLANVQHSLSNGSDAATDMAFNNAQIGNKFGNMKAMQSSALASYTTETLPSLTGTVNGAPISTWSGNKNTLIQDITVVGFGAGTETIVAGTIIEVTGRNRIGLATRSPFTDALGGQVLWSGTVTEDLVLSSGAGTLKVAGSAIFETDGQYNSVDSAIADGDVVTIKNAIDTVFQPNLFYHKQAFGIGSVPLKKLYATDTLATTKDGLQIRCSKYSDGDANLQKVRFDLLPAYVTFNPFMSGQGFGV